MPTDLHRSAFPPRVGRCLLLGALCGLLLLPLDLVGQTISGDIVGTILDASGGAVPNPIVSARNIATGVRTKAKGGSQGEYRISNLPAGVYNLTASAVGFADSTIKSVDVLLNQTATVNLTLRIGSVSTAVEVRAASPPIDTTTAQIQGTFTSLETSDLPIASVPNGVLNLSLLRAGVASNGGVGVGAGPSVGGQRPRNNNFTVEGVDDNNKSVTGPTVTIPNESVAEFTLLQNEFQAEYGHSSGGQFNIVVKSGTNDFHGLLYEYLMNRELNALDEKFAHQNIFTKQRFDQSHIGGNFGGPLKAEKLFFFGSFEYNPLGRAGTTSAPVHAPTESGYAALAAVPGISQTNLGVLKQYAVAPAVTAGSPSITLGNVTVPTGIIPISAPNYVNSYNGVLSFDANLSERDQLRARYIWNKTDAVSATANLPAFYTPQSVDAHLATLAEYHTFTPRLTNEFRAGYSRYNSHSPAGDQTYPGLDEFPTLSFIDMSLQVGPNLAFPQATVTNLYSMTDNVTWIHGNHTFKAGTEFRDSIAPSQFTPRLRGDYEYTKIANYLLDDSPDYVAQRTVGRPIYYGNQLATYSFVQDAWRMRPNLTLNLGLRYEYSTVPLGMQAQKLNAVASVPGLLTFDAPAAFSKAWGPRVGLAYSPGNSGNTAIRAGFGIAYDVIFDNIGLNTLPPEFSTTINAPAGLTGFLANGGITQSMGLASLQPAAARAATSSYIPDQKLPYAINWNLGVQHVFAHDYTLEVRYLGTRGVHLLQQTQLNIQSPVSEQQSIPTFLSVPSTQTLASLPLTVGRLRSAGYLIPSYAAAGFTRPITSYVPTGWSLYNGLSVQLNRRFANGIQYQVAYTWSHNIDNSTMEVASSLLTPRRPADFANLAAEKADSALDRRHRLALSVIYEAPWCRRSRNWFAHNLLGNWEFAPIYIYESPEYYTVQSGVDANLNFDSVPDRAIINPGGVAGTGSTVIGLDRNGNQIPLGAPTAQTNNIVAYVAQNPSARYIQAGFGAYANSGRNTEPIRPIDNIDFSLVKRFSIAERFRLEVAGQAFNLLNHPQYVPGVVDNISPASVTNVYSSAALNYVTVGAAHFNDPTFAFGSTPRMLQITAKLSW